MKNLRYLLLIIVLVESAVLLGQEKKSSTPAKPVEQDTGLVVIERHDGVTYFGRLVSRNSKEALIIVEDLGEISIPMYEIASIKKVKAENINTKGRFIQDEIFATRYHISTNGLPVQKGEHYGSLSLLGPEIHFGVSDNLSLGVVTTWFASVFAVGKYSIKISDKTHLGTGFIAGGDPFDLAGKIALGFPFVSITRGSRVANFTVTYGHAFYSLEDYDWDTDIYDRNNYNCSIASVAFMFKLGQKTSFVFESQFIMDNEDEAFKNTNLYLPAIRFQGSPVQAFQIGLGVLEERDYGYLYPIPLLQYFRKIR